MENIQRVDPDKWEEIPALAELYSHLPTTLRCSRVKNSTQYRKKNNTANTYAYIGYNPPNVTRYIVIDLDYEDAISAYYYNNAPLPQYINENPLNGHCQLVYQIRDPVTFYSRSKSAPIRLLTATENALRELLGGDKGFTGYLAKNALSSAHNVYITGAKPYTLAELSANLDLERIEDITAATNDHTYGRNSGTFDAVRIQAYKIASKLNYTQLYNECLSLAQSHNARYDTPMSYNEVKGIAKSIAEYCKSQAYISSLSELQARKGAKGGKVSKRKPSKTSARTKQPWLELGISRRTYYRDLNKNDYQK